jgi:hypothetical protein
LENNKDGQVGEQQGLLQLFLEQKMATRATWFRSGKQRWRLCLGFNVCCPTFQTERGKSLSQLLPENNKKL